MNSSNNSKFKNLDELKARMAAKNSGGGFGGAGGAGGGGGFGGGGFGGGFTGKIPKQEKVTYVYDDEKAPGKMFDFDMDQVDKSLMPPKDITKPIMVCCVGVLCIIFGCFIGWCWQGVLADRASVNERIDVAKKIEDTVLPKINAFQSYAQVWKQRSESLGAGVLEYNHDFFNDVISNYKSKNFILDVSTDLNVADGNVISMASNATNNPLSDLRGFGAGTTLLGVLLDSHIKQTNADMAEIQALLGKSSATDKHIVYALKVDPAKMIAITGSIYSNPPVERTDRMVEAFTSTEIYQVKRAITDDREASEVFKQMIESGKLTAEEAKARTYSEADDVLKKWAKEKAAKDAKAGKKVDQVAEFYTDPNLVLPKRLIYVIEDRNGASQYVFADEIILLNREKLFSESANALERYRKRMIQILAILGEIEKSTDGLQNRLHIIATEEKL